MSKKAEAQIRKRIAKEGKDVQQLCLDNIQIFNMSSTIKKLIEGCLQLQYLTLNNCKLQSLENFPHLKKLVVLELSDNKLTGEDLSKICHCQHIKFFTIDCNNIVDMQYIDALRPLNGLQILQIHDNRIADPAFDYRRAIFQKLPSLISVDCIDRSGNRIQDDDISQYITNRERSQNGSDEEQFEQNQEGDEQSMNSPHRSSETKTNRDGGEQRIKNNVCFDVHFPKRRLASDCESEDEGQMIKDFKKKMRKGE